MKKNRLFAFLVLLGLLLSLLIGCGTMKKDTSKIPPEPVQVPESVPEEIPDELPEEPAVQEDVVQDDAVPEEPAQDSETDPIIARLTDGYWECMIQCRKVYKFYEDGMIEEYDIEPLAPVKEEYLSLWETYAYSIDGNAVWLKDNYGYETKLEWVTKADPIDWDGGEKHFPDNEEFLYEVDWIPSDFPPDNAMYLRKSKLPDPNAPNAAYEDLIYQLYTDVELGVNSHAYYDMDDNGIDELIVYMDHWAGEVGNEYHIYTLKDNMPELVGVTSAADASLYVPNDGNDGLYIFSTNAWAFFLEQITIQNNEIVRDWLHTESGDTGFMEYTPPGTEIEWENYRESMYFS